MQEAFTWGEIGAELWESSEFARQESDGAPFQILWICSTFEERQRAQWAQETGGKVGEAVHKLDFLRSWKPYKEPIFLWGSEELSMVSEEKTTHKQSNWPERLPLRQISTVHITEQSVWKLHFLTLGF